VTLSRPEELGRFFDGFRHAILGRQVHMTVIGTFKIQMQNGPLYKGWVLLDSDRGWYFDQVAVQRQLEEGPDLIYYLPHHFLRDWRKRFGRGGHGKASFSVGRSFRVREPKNWSRPTWSNRRFLQQSVQNRTRGQGISTLA